MLADIVVGVWGLSVLGVLGYGVFRQVVAIVPPGTPVLGKFKRQNGRKQRPYKDGDDFPFSELPATFDPTRVPHSRF